MSTSDEEDIFTRLQAEDVILLEELKEVKDDYEKTIQIQLKRVSLYSEYSKQTLNPMEQEIIITQQQMILLQIGLTNIRQELQTDIATLTSRVDDMESKR